MDDFTQFIGFLLVFFGLQALYWITYTHWSRRNIKGPTPLPIFGNLLSFFIWPRQELETYWPKKYGKIYGTYLGYKPYLTCADATVLRRICVKDFDKFPNHLFAAVRNKYQDLMLIFTKDDHWRAMRALLTPTFTNSKMKASYNRSCELASDLIEQIKIKSNVGQQGEGLLNLKTAIGAHVMGVSMSSFYGLDARKTGHRGLEEFSRRNNTAAEQTFFRFFINCLLPVSLVRWLNLPLLQESKFDYFAQLSEKIIEARKKSPGQYKDYLQLLLDARISNIDEVEEEKDQLDSHHIADKGADDKRWHPSKMHLTEEEVSCQAMMFLMVAPETTVSLIASTLYVLAHHQDIQEKLYQEVKQFKHKLPEYEQLNSLLYLDCVISESLRLYSPAISLDRVANEDYYVKEYDITIPKGTIINLAFYAILRDSDYWPEPEKFDPDRFLPENKSKIVPGSYCPFGLGPRSCIGYRFALTEAKTVLVTMVNEFHFDKAPGTKYPPEPELATFVFNALKNLLVTIRKRN